MTLLHVKWTGHDKTNGGPDRLVMLSRSMFDLEVKQKLPDRLHKRETLRRD